MNLLPHDSEVTKIISAEIERQTSTLNMIPSENFTSREVRAAVGSVLMHKYAEGNIGKRYYEGNENIDDLEMLTISRAKKLFKLPADWEVNVQALSGSNANLAIYLALLNLGDTMMGMYLPDGGHLSHGWSYDPKKRSLDSKSDQHAPPIQNVYLGGKNKVNITSRMFKVIQYKTNPVTQLLDYDELERIATEYKPKLIITGGTAYTRNIDYKRVKLIAEKLGAIYLADIAHEAGLVAAGVIPSPVGIADVISMTTHKTLRSARGAIILGSKDIIAKVNKAILPGLQGGPFNNNIAGICVGLGEALRPEFRDYAAQIITNAQTLAAELKRYEFDLVTGGTDKHLILINLTSKGIFGKYTAKALAKAGIILNMNTMPGEQRSPADPSAIRLGTPWLTTQGLKEPEMKLIASYINDLVNDIQSLGDLNFADFELAISNSKIIKDIRSKVKILTQKFPLPI